MLDDLSVISQRDPSDALGVASQETNQLVAPISIENSEIDDRQITNVVLGGMGGSALAALVAKSWLKDQLNVPFEIYRTYDIPEYVSSGTLFIASSYSGNTEETLSALEQAQNVDALVAIIASGGQLIDKAKNGNMPYVEIPSGMQPRMAVNYNLKALVSLLVHFGLCSKASLDEISNSANWLAEETANWMPNIETEKNYAKQLAMQIVGKTPIFYSGSVNSPVGYKFKISLNENGKNVAYCNEYPEVSHNEFIGWTSHPVDKPFAVFDLVSSYDHPQVLKRFELSQRLLSGKRPHAFRIELKGESILNQLLWGSILADFVGIYVGILNGVDPTQVDLIEKLKNELK